ncbi:YcxB family protein [Flavihumibacter profundi]|uniref:YcxB family protein n=1 Tax=Flavihumibacter profundi TaxID=2716883 RepID=UPI001CC38AAB|nr:YcxB family protein [Flavihumibacter profundi]MBZ5858516.1 YcxB family protein [Flavihumibacter profundi]
MNISFSYDRKQVIQALRYHFFSLPEIRLLVILINLFTIVAAVLLYFKKISPFAFLLFSTLWMALMLAIWRILPNSIYKKAATFQDDFVMSINPDEIVLNTTRGTQLWPWQRFSKFLETPYFFHLYFDKRSFFLIPKDAFDNIAALQEARELFKKMIPLAGLR